MQVDTIIYRGVKLHATAGVRGVHSPSVDDRWSLVPECLVKPTFTESSSADPRQRSNRPMRILLIEDDLDLGNGIRLALEQQSMTVVWVRRLTEAEAQLAAGGVELVLLDLGLPDGDGMTLLTQLRRQDAALPVLILSARDRLDDRLHGLDNGADDYLVKPFALAELLSRVRALERRRYGLQGDALVLRDLQVRVATQRVTVGGRDVELSGSEFALLVHLLRHSDKVVTRRVLEEQVLPGGSSLVSNALDVHISNLRRKIGEGYIRTVRGVGFVADREPPAAKGQR